MQPNENFNVARRALDIDDYIDVVRRHKGWIFGPFLFAIVASVVGVYLWPDTYVSQAVVKVVPQSVPENMVQSSVNQQMYDRILSMQQEILSRNTLTTIINTYGLYKRELSSMPIDDVVEEMRKKISIVPVQTANNGGANRTVPAFGVQFSYEDRNKAQKVVQDLVGKFLDASTRNRSNAAFQTTQFMQDEFDRAKKELDDVEGRLQSFRVTNNGRLPDQVDSNMRQLSSLQAQAGMLENSINRATQEKLQMESNLRINREQLAVMKKDPVETVGGVQRNEKLTEAEREVQSWESQLTTMRQHYKDTHPDVQVAMGRLEAAKHRRDALLKEENDKKSEPAAARPATPQTVRETRELEASAQRLQSAIEGKDLEIQQYTKEIQSTSRNVQAYQGRIETVPLGEKQYGDLLRDRDIAKIKYVEREEKLNRARLAREMEDRKQGEMLEQLDPASLPISPTEPKRPLVISVGAGLGLLLGIVVAGAREMKDTSLKNLKDVRAYTQMSVLGSIPLLENDFVVRRRKRLAWLGWTTACLAAAVISSGSVVYYYVTKV